MRRRIIRRLLAVGISAILAVGAPIGVWAGDVQDIELVEEEQQVGNLIQEEEIEDEKAVYKEDTEVNSEASNQGASDDSIFEFTVNGNEGTAVINGYKGNNTDVVIPSTINGYRVTKVENFQDSNKLKKVEISEGIEAISDNAFMNCPNLTTVLLPKTITEIGSSAFANCAQLSLVQLPESLRVISSYAFSNCQNLETIDIPDSVAIIRNSAFENSGLQQISLPENLDRIGNLAFSNTKLENIVIPRKVQYLGTSVSGGSFYGCSRLKRVIIQGSPCMISHYDATFSGCQQLDTVVVYGNPTDGFNTLNWGIRRGAAIYASIGSNAYDYAMSNKNSFYPLDPPENFRISKKDENIFHLTWDSKSNISGYRIYRKIDNEYNLELIAELPSDQNYYDDLGVEIGKKYSYVISIVYQLGEGVIEGIQSDTLSQLIELDIPENIQVITNTESMLIQWDAVKDVNGYEIYRRDNSGEELLCGTVTGDITSFEDRDILESREYSYSIRSFIQRNENIVYSKKSEWTNPMGLVIEINNAVVGTVEEAEYTGKPITPKVAVDYQGVRLTEGEDYTLSYEYNVKIGTAYIIIKGINKYVGEKTIPFNIIKPSVAQPNISSISVVSSKYIKLNWKSVSGAKGYRLYRKSNGSSWKEIKTLSGTSYTDKNVKFGTKYTYTVRAYKMIKGTNYWSTYNKTGKSVTVTYSEPMLLSVKTSSYNALKLTWKKVSGVSGYRVYRKTSANGSYKAIATLGNVSTYTDKKAAGGTTYIYTVRGYKKSGSKYIWGRYDLSGIKGKAKRQPRKLTLASGKTYTDYDVTGDGIRDKVLVKTKVTGRTSHQIDIYINGKNAYSYVQKGYSPQKYVVHLCTPYDNAIFFSIRYESGDNDCQTFHKMYRYKKGKLKLSYDVQKSIGISGAFSGSYLSSVGNGYIIVEYYRWEGNNGPRWYTLRLTVN